MFRSPSTSLLRASRSFSFQRPSLLLIEKQQSFAKKKEVTEKKSTKKEVSKEKEKKVKETKKKEEKVPKEKSSTKKTETKQEEKSKTETKEEKKPSTPEPQKNSQINQLAQHVEEGVPKNAGLKDILKAVWSNAKVTAVCPDLIIRLTSLRGQVSRRVWELRGGNPSDVQILAVGTVAIPQHLPGYHKFLDNFYKHTSEQVQNTTLKGDHNYEVGYDLFSKGAPEARKAVLNLFNDHFGFSKTTLDACMNNSAITCGGMRGLKDLADGLILSAKEKNVSHRFIQPDNSFGTWWNIIERPDKNDRNRREINTLMTSPKNKLHLSPEDVKKYYDNNSPATSESWYITPVGNPSGTKMTSQQLAESVSAIVQRSPNATIILDSVYIRTLSTEDGVKLMSELNHQPKLLNNIIFLESFSKSHGLCRERLGTYFSVNEGLFTRLHAANIGFSAGPGVHKDFQFLALGNSSAEDKEGVASLHQFWLRERRGLFKYLLSAKYSHLFEANQEHITDDDMNNPLGLYILLRSKPGVKAADILMETGVLGVDTVLLSGHFIRFSVGTLTEPTYSQYA